MRAISVRVGAGPRDYPRGPFFVTADGLTASSFARMISCGNSGAFPKVPRGSPHTSRATAIGTVEEVPSMLRTRLAALAFAITVSLGTGCMSSCDRPLLSRLGLHNGSCRNVPCETCGQVAEGPVLDGCAPGCPTPCPTPVLEPQPGFPPMGPPPRLIPTPQPPNMPYAPGVSDGSF
jgi:hypothetical protein